ncbi:MAG TPA: hypothetical protein PKM65_12480 [Spirochaetota bacterium]|nr:hypothetical protein [Spirochaetota bacterium]HNT09616.1 hypothetical protein [Spirochaetota bacterium]HNV47898.1 hypothetical protein [Spirochaetota bacterium]HOS39573.1 hypothetical protein [Spirochaetota bacterium]HPI21652.1 hypothetical protein [Spirochaetota bacterium]
MEIRALGTPIHQELPSTAAHKALAGTGDGEDGAIKRHPIQSEQTMLEPDEVKQLFFVLIGHGVHAVPGSGSLGAHVNTVA